MINLSASRGAGSGLAVALCLLAFAPRAHATSITIYGDTADTQVHLGGIFGSDPGANGGEIGVNGGFDYSNVYVFQLPSLASGESITGANFSFYVTASGSNYNSDLYGLQYRASPTVLVSDWYSGPNDVQNALLQSAIIPPSFSFSGRIDTSNTGDANLAAYLTNQYGAGAVGGNYVFLRLSNSVAGGANLNVNFVYNADVAYFLDSVNPGTLATWQGRYSPRLDITTASVAQTAPEPATAAGIVCGLVALLVVSWRRG